MWTHSIGSAILAIFIQGCLGNNAIAANPRFREKSTDPPQKSSLRHLPIQQPTTPFEKTFSPLSPQVERFADANPPEDSIEWFEPELELLEDSEDPFESFEPASEQLEPLAEPSESPAEVADPSSLRVDVQSIWVEGSTVFSPDELAQTVQAFTGQSLTLEELQAAANAVTQLYLNAGYITTKAVLPPQDIQDGVVRLQVIEGGLEDIQVEGSQRLARYVQRRVALAVGSPLNQTALENQLRLLQLDPLFDKVEASLRQGQSPDSSILVIRVSEAPPFSGSLSVDTLSPSSVGQYRTGATLQYLNLAGLGDRLRASAYRTTTGGANAYELSYQIPLNPMNGTLLLRAAPSDYRITDPDEPAFELGLSGSTDVYEIRYRQPVIRTLHEEFALSVGFRYRNGSTLLAGLITPPLVTSVFYLEQDYLKRDPQGVWGAQSQFRLGSRLFNATNRNDGLPDGQFFSWKGQVQRLQVLGRDHHLLIQGQVQLTPDSLLGSEQSFIGGAQSVRGYGQNQRFGDNGVRLSIENQITLVREEDGRPLAKVNPFLDLGYVWYTNSDSQPTRENFLLGIGAGFELNPLENLTSRIDIGFPLISANELSSDRATEPQVYFNIQYQF